MTATEKLVLGAVIVLLALASMMLDGPVLK